MQQKKLFEEIVKEALRSKKLDSGTNTVTMSAKEVVKILEKRNEPDYEEIVEYLKKLLLKKSMVINSGRNTDTGDPIKISASYLQFRGDFIFKIIPTWDEIVVFASMLNESIDDEIYYRIKSLTQPQSEVLIEEIFSNPKLDWVKDFKLSETRHDDGGRDFTASLLIKENKREIGFSGYGKMIPCIGQLKHLKDEMGPGDMRDFIGTMRNSRMNYGIIISTNGFTPKSLEAAKVSGYTIFCYDAHHVANFMIENEIGIKNIRIRTGKISDEEWWNEIQLPS